MGYGTPDPVSVLTKEAHPWGSEVALGWLGVFALGPGSRRQNPGDMPAIGHRLCRLQPTGTRFPYWKVPDAGRHSAGRLAASPSPLRGR